MTKSITFIAALIAGATVSAFACAPAYAETDAAPALAVQTSDINLNSSEGVKKLQHRIHAAAKAVCGSNDDVRDLGGHALAQQCVVATTSRAMAAYQAMVAAPSGASGKTATR
jgi:UrcA family protein